MRSVDKGAASSPLAQTIIHYIKDSQRAPSLQLVISAKLVPELLSRTKVSTVSRELSRVHKPDFPV